MAWLMAPLVAFLVAAPLKQVDGAGQQKVRQAAVAGSFYPADPKELSGLIDGMLAHASPPPAEGPILAAVAPHAGYPYSGPVAAWTYAALKGKRYSRVVVIAPSHYVGFDFTSVYDGDAYETPLGTIPVDKEFALQLTRMSSTIRLSEQGHTPTSAGSEHAIEVQLPWLQKVLGNFQLVPIVMGDQSYESSRALGVALAKMLDAEKKAADTRRNTRPRQLRSLPLPSLRRGRDHRPQDSACARGLGLLQHVAQFSDAHLGGLRRRAHRCRHDLRRAHGRQQAEVLRYANSGDAPGDHSRVVGYSADLFVKVRARRGSRAAVLAHRPGEKPSCSPWPASPVEYSSRKQEALCTRRRAQAKRSIANTAPSSRSLRTACCAAASATPRPSSRSTSPSATQPPTPRCTIRASARRSLGAAAACLRDLRPLAAAPRHRHRTDQGGQRRPSYEERRKPGPAAASGSRRAELGPADLPGTNLHQSRHASELLERREHRHLQIHSRRLRRPQAIGVPAWQSYCTLTYAGSIAAITAAENPSHVQEPSCPLHPGTKMGAVAGGFASVSVSALRICSSVWAVYSKRTNGQPRHVDATPQTTARRREVYRLRVRR